MLFIKLINVGAPDTTGRRTSFYELNGMPRESVVADNSLKSVSTAARQKGDADGSIASLRADARHGHASIAFPPASKSRPATSWSSSKP